MAYGENPTLKRVGTKTVKYCETCKRLMKVPDRCEKCPPIEPCYYCHLQRHHVKQSENSQKKTLKQQT